MPGIKSTVYPQAPAGLMFPGDDGYPGRGTTNGKMAQFAPRLGAIWTPGGDGNTSIRAGWGVFYDTPHLFFNTRFANNPPWGAQITLSNPAGGWADPYLDVSRRQSVPGAQHRLGDAAVPGVRRLRERADGHQADVAAAVERQRAAAVRRLDAVDDLSRQPVDALVAGDRAQSRGLRAGRDDRQHQPAAPADPAEPGGGAVLRHDRTRRRHRPRHLSRPAAVGAAPAEEQPQRPRPTRRCRSACRIRRRRKSPGRRSSIRTIRISTTRTARRIAATCSTSPRSSASPEVRQRRASRRCSATGSSRRWSAGRAATARR